MKTPAFKTFIGTVAVLGSLVDLSQAAASNVIFPTNYPYTQTNLRTMDVIKSKNGVLEASVIMHSAGTNSAPIKYGLVDAYSGIGSSNVTSTGTNAGMYGFAYQWSAYGTNYPRGFPGTMLQIERGDTLKVRTINNMGVEFNTNDATFTTSFHYHGSHAPDLSQGDNVYVLNAPGSVNDVTIPVAIYENSVGLNWYHPHPDLYTDVQVQGGLAGLLMVGDPLDAYPAYKGKLKQVNMAFSEVNLQTNSEGKFQFFKLQTGDVSGTNYTRGWQKMVNGQMNPIITIAPGETQIWNWGWVGARGALMPVIADANLSNAWSNCTILARDGNSAFVRPYKGTLGAYLPGTNVYTPRLQDIGSQSLLSTGGRTSWAMTAPTNPGTYYLMDAFGGEESPNNDSGTQYFYVLATINVTGDPVKQEPPILFLPQPADPLWSEKPDVYRWFGLEQQFFSYVDPRYLDTIDSFYINGKKFGEGLLDQLEIGTVEEWTIVNGGPLNHPFHIHQGNFIVTQVNGVWVQPELPPNPEFSGVNYVSPQDVAFVPAYGSITLRLRVQNFPGKFVWHCHILEHEDEGMMSPVFQFGNTEGLRLALGTTSQSTVVVNGKGNRVGTVNAFPNYRGPVVTASGIGTPTEPAQAPSFVGTAEQINAYFRSKYTKETMAFGTGSQASWVRVYENGALKPTATFSAFAGKAGVGGVSLAVGALGQYGTVNIAVGSRTAGAANVRLFDTKGSLVREFKGVLPGRFPNGVNVAVGDVDADNYDDLIVSAGAGREAIITALSGRDIVNGVADPEKCFTFVAPGGSRDGVKVAVGFLAPSTVPSYKPNLITTPESGRNVGTVSVWNMADICQCSTHEGHAMSAMAAMPKTGVETPPMPVATFRPFGTRGAVNLAVNLATTYQRQLGGQAQPVVAAWQTPREVAFTAIGLDNMPRTVKRRF